MSRERSKSPRAQGTVETVRLLGERSIVASYTDAIRRANVPYRARVFLKRTERRFTASFFERLETGRMMLGAMGRRRSRAEAMMMMDAMMAMDDVSTAFLGCGGGTRNERVIPRVEETTRGFLITVNAPGARAEDVHARATTDARGRATLRVRIRGREAIELGLPSKCVDVRAVPRASCIDGVLRIAVVKKSPEILRVPVESATEKAPSAETDDENENSDSVTTLSVPGFGARDISVTLHKPEDFLVVEGASKTFGNFKKTFTNVPPELQLKHLTATVEHGLLHIKMEDPTAIEPMDVVVSNVALSDEDVESNKKLVALLRRSVAGVSADKVTCRLTADRTLRVEVRTSHHGRASVSINVPRNLDLSTLEARCADGILTVTCERDESAGSQTVDIEVSGEQPAEFIDAPVETTAPGELPTTEAPEAIDYDGRVEDFAEQ